MYENKTVMYSLILEINQDRKANKNHKHKYILYLRLRNTTNCEADETS